MTQLTSSRGEEAQSRRLRLLLVTVGLGVGGTEGQIAEIATRLDRSRFDVKVCVFKGEGPLAYELRGRGVPVVTLGGVGKWDVRVLYRLFRLVSGEKPDVIHAFLSLANIACGIVGRLLRIPVLILSYRGLELSKSSVAVLLERMIVRRASAITCCSEAVRQFVLSQFGGMEHRCITIHNGVDCKEFNVPKSLSKTALGLKEDVAVIGTVSRLDEPIKGLSVLLQAMARLHTCPGLPHFQLLIVGEGAARMQLQDLSDSLGIAERVVFAGMRRDIPRLLALMEIFVLPSKYEGFGIALVEAMAAGRPVVATEVGGIPEVVTPGETGLLVQPGDPTGLAEAIEALLRDGVRGRELGKRGQQEAWRRFGIETVVDQHTKLYETLAASSALIPTERKMSPRRSRSAVLASGESRVK